MEDLLFLLLVHRLGILMKIFYSWQSDIDNKKNRSLIKSALEKAIKDLNTLLSIEEPDRKIELDHDTKNIPGTPDLAGTIFEKISQSAAFIADVSFIGETLDNKKISNPNVLIELGYAFSKLGSDKIICIMNTEFGMPESLPFDLRHKRFPIQYSTQSDKSSEEKKQLAEQLRRAILSIIQFGNNQNENLILPSNPSVSDILRVILESDSVDDWEKGSDEFGTKSIKFYKGNVNLRFEIIYNEEGMQNKDFREKWANKHPDPNATGYWCKLYYSSTLVQKFVLVSVDGGRAMLPIPESPKSGVVNPLNYKVAQIHDSINTLDEYMKRSGLQLVI